MEVIMKIVKSGLTVSEKIKIEAIEQKEGFL